MENGPAFLGSAWQLHPTPEATASTDRTAKIWCADSGECALVVSRGHFGRVYVDTNSMKTGPFLNNVE